MTFAETCKDFSANTILMQYKLDYAKDPKKPWEQRGDQKVRETGWKRYKELCGKMERHGKQGILQEGKNS